jgi:two-component system, NtrC family, response regulator GlrR
MRLTFAGAFLRVLQSAIFWVFALSFGVTALQRAPDFRCSKKGMAHRSKYRGSSAARRVKRVADDASDLPANDEVFSIGFYSLEQHDPDEGVLRAALENTGDFAWRRLASNTGGQELMPSVSEVTASRPSAVIAVLNTAETSVVEPLFARLRSDDPRRPILVASRGLTADGISVVLSHGASDFLLPPYRSEDLLPRLRRFLHLAPRSGHSMARIRAGVGLRNIVGQSAALLGEVKKLPRIATCDAPVLIRGESGTGKEVFARAVHYLSHRAGEPFVPINCGAIPEALLESELFGHRRGAFTGAVKDRVGLVGEADGGTIFLDEVDALPLLSQVKLLRFLQDGEFRPLGASKPVCANVRVIAAGNADFDDIVRERKFREDFYYRLNVLRILLPPLRERQGDLPLLAHHLLERQALLLGCARKKLAACAITALANYPWPGNVRELENVLTRALVFSDGSAIQAQDLSLPFALEESGDESFRSEKERMIRVFERDYLQKMLTRHDGNITHAARAAAKNRRAFWELLRKHGLAHERRGSETGKEHPTK